MFAKECRVQSKTHTKKVILIKEMNRTMHVKLESNQTCDTKWRVMKTADKFAQILHKPFPSICSGGGGNAKSYLETFDIQVSLTLSGHFQPRIQSFHQWFCITDILQVPVGPKIQHFHGLGDVLYLLNGERILTLDWQDFSSHCLDHFMGSKKASSNPRTQTTLYLKGILHGNEWRGIFEPNNFGANVLMISP